MSDVKVWGAPFQNHDWLNKSTFYDIKQSDTISRSSVVVQEKGTSEKLWFVYAKLWQTNKTKNNIKQKTFQINTLFGSTLFDIVFQNITFLNKP